MNLLLLVQVFEKDLLLFLAHVENNVCVFIVKYLVLCIYGPRQVIAGVLAHIIVLIIAILTSVARELSR